VHAAVPLRLKKAQKQFAYVVSRSELHGLTSVIGGAELRRIRAALSGLICIKKSNYPSIRHLTL
jgi:hypothetical protein